MAAFDLYPVLVGQGTVIHAGPPRNRRSRDNNSCRTNCSILEFTSTSLPSLLLVAARPWVCAQLQMVL